MNKTIISLLSLSITFLIVACGKDSLMQQQNLHQAQKSLDEKGCSFAGSGLRGMALECGVVKTLEEGKEKKQALLDYIDDAELSLKVSDYDDEEYGEVMAKLYLAHKELRQVEDKLGILESTEE